MGYNLGRLIWRIIRSVYSRIRILLKQLTYLMHFGAAAGLVITMHMKDLSVGWTWTSGGILVMVVMVETMVTAITCSSTKIHKVMLLLQ